MYGIRVGFAEDTRAVGHPDTTPAGNNDNVYEVQ